MRGPESAWLCDRARMFSFSLPGRQSRAFSMALGGRGHQPPARARILSPASANGTSWAGNSGSAAWSADRGSLPPVTGFRVDGRRFRRRIRSSGTASPVSVGVPTSCVARTSVPRPFDRRPGFGAGLELGLPTALPWSCMPQARTTRHVSSRARCPHPQGNTCRFAQMSLLTCLAQLGPTCALGIRGRGR